MIPIDRLDTEEKRARIELMIETYRGAAMRRLVRKATRLWRKAEARQQFVALDAPPERVH